MNKELSANKSDSLGALASGLCLIHCIATPFLFVAKSCSSTCCADAPSWWRWLDIVFLVISAIAVYYSAANTTKKWISNVLWGSWFVLFLVVLNEQIHVVDIPHFIIYLPALTLILTHIYNIRYCQCGDAQCSKNLTNA